MLVLSRKRGESVVIAGEIVVTIIEMGKNRVQLGVQAPPNMPVHREEIHRRIVAEHAPGRRRTASFSQPPPARSMEMIPMRCVAEALT